MSLSDTQHLGVENHESFRYDLNNGILLSWQALAHKRTIATSIGLNLWPFAYKWYYLKFRENFSLEWKLIMLINLSANPMV
jgi:hypothetical protein